MTKQWKIALFIMLILSMFIIIFDFAIVIFQGAGWTYIGFITLWFAIFIGSICYEALFEGGK